MSLDVTLFLVDDFLYKYDKLRSFLSSIDSPLRDRFEKYYDLLKNREIDIPLGAKLHTKDEIPDVLYFLNRAVDDCLVESAESLRSMAKRSFKRCRQRKDDDIKTLDANFGHLKTIISKQRGSSVSAPHKPASIPLLNYNVHGFEDQFNEILKKITTSSDQGTSKPNMRAVGIVGIGGSGKTTLASMLFNSRQVREKYPIMIWASLTCTLDKKESTRSSVFMEILGGVQNNDNLKTMLQKIKYNQGGSKMPDHVLDKYIKHFKLALQRNSGKYLIVLDDVWETDYWFAENEGPKEKVDKTESPKDEETEVPNDGGNDASKDEEPKSKWVLSREWIRKTGGTIVVTSRLEEMADNIVGMSNLHMIPPVSNAACVDIFVDRVTRDGHFKREDDKLQKFKKYIENQCFGLPLAAITVADIVIADPEEAAKKEQAEREPEATKLKEETAREAEAAKLKEEAEREAEAAKLEEAERETEAAKLEEAEREAEAAKLEEEAEREAEAAKLKEEAQREVEATKLKEEVEREVEAAKLKEEAAREAEAAKLKGDTDSAKLKAEAEREAEAAGEPKPDAEVKEAAIQSKAEEQTEVDAAKTKTEADVSNFNG